MPETGYSLGLPTKTLVTCRPTLNTSSIPGECVVVSSLPRKKKSGMCTLSLALLDRIIPTTSGGKNQSITSITVPNLILSIMITFFVAREVTFLRIKKEHSWPPMEFHLISLPMERSYTQKDFSVKRCGDSLMTSWSSILISWMQQWEPCVQNKGVLVKKPLYDWEILASRLPDPPGEDLMNSIEGCMQHGVLCSNCLEKGEPIWGFCDWFRIKGNDYWEHYS